MVGILQRATAPAMLEGLVAVDGATGGFLQDSQLSEGTWTPVLTFSTPGNLSVAYTTQTGTWTQIGNQVTLNCTLVLSSFTHTTASGNLHITGSPFAAKNVTGQQQTGATRFEGITKVGYTNFAAVASANSSIIILVGSGSGVAADVVKFTDMPTGGTVRVYFTLTYQV